MRSMELKSFGQRVRARRVEEGWSQEELARKAGISRNYLSQIERGVATNLSWQVMEKLVTELGLRTSEIFEEQWDWSNLPPSLAEFARKFDLPADDVSMLARIRYRGRQPNTPEEWQLLYNAIRIATEEA
jgi:transcriptional regulator with XRE-family HTH domain